ncbi:hypothetical protein TrRE_jg7297, partial [Triparma retinervis]
LQDELKFAVTSAKHSFNNMASKDTNTITKKQLVTLLEESNYPATEAELAMVMKVLEENGGLIENDHDSIVEDAFKAVVVPWLSLSILDVDRNGTIDLNELKCLLWVHQDQGTPEPSEERVRKTMAALDLDFSGAIDRMEWLEYNVTCDPHSRKITPSHGTQTFFRTIDENYDSDRKVLANKLRQQVTEQGTAAVQWALDSMNSQADRDIILNVIKGIAMDVLTELDPHNRGVILLADVRNYQHQLDFKIKKLVDYSVDIAKVEVKENMINHGVVLDFQDMEHRDGGGAVAKARLRTHQSARNNK